MKRTSIPQNIRSIAKRLKRVQDQARKLGLFCEDRELLSCPNCGLTEDVTIEGRLITVHDVEEGTDIGLRFSEPDENGVSRCPRCGGKVELEGLWQR